MRYSEREGAEIGKLVLFLHSKSVGYKKGPLYSAFGIDDLVR